MTQEYTFRFTEAHELGESQQAFEMALELLRDWRLDRYYAARLKLFDFVLSNVIPEAAAGGEAAAPAADKSGKAPSAKDG